MRKKLAHILESTIQDCFTNGKLREVPLPEYVIEVPNNPSHGHFATNMPLTLASQQKRPPREIANIIVDHLKDNENLIQKV